MGKREKQDLYAFLYKGCPMKRNDLGGVGIGRARERRVDVGEAQSLFRTFSAEKHRWRGEARMVQEEASEFGSGITGDARDGNTQRIGGVIRQ